MKTSPLLTAIAVVTVLHAITGCGIAKQIFTPEQARLEEQQAKNEAEVAKTPDGECGQAETCKNYCETLGRPLDCYKTGKAAMHGVDVHYAGGYHVEKVAGSTDDVKVRYERESNEHQSLRPLAIDAFGRACKANHAESCRMSGQLAQKDKPTEARAFYQKACTLHDEAGCKLAEKTN
jgi:hypothetical protein